MPQVQEKAVETRAWRPAGFPMPGSIFDDMPLPALAVECARWVQAAQYIAVSNSTRAPRPIKNGAEMMDRAAARHGAISVGIQLAATLSDRPAAALSVHGIDPADIGAFLEILEEDAATEWALVKIPGAREEADRLLERIHGMAS